jgi:uncharacterized membrane protein YfcA
MLITDPWFYAVAIPAFLLTGISKGGFASGAGNMTVPLLALAIPAPQAAGIALPLLCAMDASGIRAWWGRWSARDLLDLLPGAVLGLTLGALAFGALSERHIQALVGLVTLAFLARTLHRRLARRAVQPAPPSPLRATLWGGVSGFTSTIAHAGGPPLAVYLYPRQLDRATLAATSALFFAGLNYAKLVPYFFLGQLTATNLLTSLVLLPLAPLGVALGVRLQRHLSDRAFYAVIYALLFATGVKLVWEGVLA